MRYFDCLDTDKAQGHTAEGSSNGGNGVSAAKTSVDQTDVPQAQAQVRQPTANNTTNNSHNRNPNIITCLKSGSFRPLVLPAYNFAAASSDNRPLRNIGASRGSAPKGASASTGKMVSIVTCQQHLFGG